LFICLLFCLHLPHTPDRNLVNNSLETLTVEDIKNFTEVTLLDLRSNSLRVIDDEVFSARYLPKLQQLFLSRNLLTRLPHNVFQFTVFTTLNLSHNNFKYPPPALANTNQITTLLLNNNPFQGLQKDSLANISSLRTLELSACNLTMDNIAPEVFRDFTSLRALYLDLNHFPSIERDMFASIPSVRDLNLVNNSLETLTVEDIKNFTEVTLLDLRSNSLRVIDDEVFSARYLPKLQQLFLSRNLLTRLPHNVFQFTVFTTLNLSHNNFKYPPPALANTNQITTLLLNNNPFQGLQKDSLANISSLRTLELSACNLTMDNIAPEVFRDFTSLRALYLDLNHFPSIERDMFASIPSVRDLYLQQCGIESIGRRAFEDLQSLNGLHLSHNNISELYPNSFHFLSMKTLDLSYCGIQNIRKGALRTRISNRL
jgi:Leucine-rich repeat (LRR) protein